jgi:hypothetical protein
MKIFKILPIFIICFLPIAVIGQIQVNIPSLIENSTTEDVKSVSIVNSYNSTVRANINTEVFEVKGGEKIFAINYYEVNLSSGIIFLNTLRGQSLYFNNSISSKIKFDPKFPNGDYKICVSIYPLDLTENNRTECSEFSIKRSDELHLQYPENNEVIETKNPLLQWNSTYELGTNYFIKVVELEPYIIPEEALSHNAAIFDLNLTLLSTLYPYTAKILEQQKRYAWQVYVKDENGRIVDFSEAWIFSLKKDIEIIDKRENYPLIHRDINNGSYLYEDKLRFGYLNSTNESTLNYILFDITEGRNCHCPTIPIRSGLNKIEMPIKECEGFQREHQYYVEVRDKNRSVYRLNVKEGSH